MTTARHKQSMSQEIQLQSRMFVNRSLHLANIRFYGFDLDYTLANYKSPEYERLQFDLIMKQLVDFGYSAGLLDYTYDAALPVRGLWADYLLGNLLKVDAHGNIMLATHGFHLMTRAEIESAYPNGFIHLDESRIYILNTQYNLAEAMALACIVQQYEHTMHDFVRMTDNSGVQFGPVKITFECMFQDVRRAVDAINHGPLQTYTLADLASYVSRDPRLALMLNKMRRKAKTFLLTNSAFHYTKAVLEHVLGGEGDWRQHFDFIVVDAAKPAWFSLSRAFRQVDGDTGKPNGIYGASKLQPHTVYSGGSCNSFASLVGCVGSDVLYVGDHVFGDVLKSKKRCGWRTFLVVPELAHELSTWQNNCALYTQLHALDAYASQLYRIEEPTDEESLEIDRVNTAERTLHAQLDRSYGRLGSVFRGAMRPTFYADQVQRFADVYSSSALHLHQYPFSYRFRETPLFLPHELSDLACAAQLGRQPLLQENLISEARRILDEMTDE